MLIQIVINFALPQNVVDDVSVTQHDVHMFSILYIKTSNHLIFCALGLKRTSGFVV